MFLPVHEPLLVLQCACRCEWHPKRVEDTVVVNSKRKVTTDNQTKCDISSFWQAPCQGEIVSDAHVWHTSASPLVALYMKLVLFSISSLFKCGAEAAQRGGCCAWRVGWNWTASPHYCKHHPTRQASGSWGHRVGGGGGGGGVVWERSAKTHPLRPKLFLIYMFRLFKTVTSTAPPTTTCLLRSPSTHSHTTACVWCKKKKKKACVSFLFPSLSFVPKKQGRKILISWYEGQNSTTPPQLSGK